jgi:molecular chaperone GrpE
MHNPEANLEETVTPMNPASSVTPDEAADPGAVASAPGDNSEALDSGDEPTPSFEDLEIDEVEEATAAANATIQSLKDKIQSLEGQLEQWTEQYKRIAADFENFRKRTQKEKEDLQEQTKCATLVEILPVLDNFERAKDHIKPQTEEGKTVHKSYQGLYKQFVDCLKRIGVAPMRAEGTPFDPTLHDAMMREPTAEYEEGTVMAELQRGYLLGDRVLRHAMVKVAAPPEPAEGEG